MKVSTMFTTRSTGDGMHAHDRTMIAKLGFADPDKGNDRHEQACQFLMHPEIAATFSGLVRPSASEEDYRDAQRVEISHECGTYSDGSPLTRRGEVSRKLVYKFAGSILKQSSIEVPIAKGEGQYRTTVGFLDVALYFEFTYGPPEAVACSRYECGHCDHAVTAWPGPDAPLHVCRRPWTVAIEVKIGRVPISDAIRQLEFYRSYCHADAWLLATPWPIDAHEKAALQSKGFRHILLGERFEEFCAEAEGLPDAESDFTF